MREINKLRPCQIGGSLNDFPVAFSQLWSFVFFSNVSANYICWATYNTILLFFNFSIECFKFVRWYCWYFNLLLILFIFSLLFPLLVFILGWSAYCKKRSKRLFNPVQSKNAQKEIKNKPPRKNIYHDIYLFELYLLCADAICCIKSTVYSSAVLLR